MISLLYRYIGSLRCSGNVQASSSKRPDAEDPHVTHASDSRLPSTRIGHGRGRFSSSLYPVRIPTALKYCEALILLLCRDRGSAYETYWIAILTYMLEFVDGTDILREEILGPPYKSFYHALKHADSKMYLILDKLRHDLVQARILPAPRE